MDLPRFDTQVQTSMRALLAKNELGDGTPAFAVAEQIIRQGFASLSWKQRFIYLEEMVPLLRSHGLSVGRDWHRD
jgi:hypothetical protein